MGQVIGVGKGVAVTCRVVLGCCLRRWEELLDGCLQKRVEPVSFLHVSGDLTTQRIKVERFSRACLLRAEGWSHVLEGWEGVLIGAGFGRVV